MHTLRLLLLLLPIHLFSLLFSTILCVYRGRYIRESVFRLGMDSMQMCFWSVVPFAFLYILHYVYDDDICRQKKSWRYHLFYTISKLWRLQPHDQVCVLCMQGRIVHPRVGCEPHVECLMYDVIILYIYIIYISYVLCAAVRNVGKPRPVLAKNISPIPYFFLPARFGVLSSTCAQNPPNSSNAPLPPPSKTLLQHYPSPCTCHYLSNQPSLQASNPKLQRDPISYTLHR